MFPQKEERPVGQCSSRFLKCALQTCCTPALPPHRIAWLTICRDPAAAFCLCYLIAFFFSYHPRCASSPPLSPPYRKQPLLLQRGARQHVWPGCLQYEDPHLCGHWQHGAANARSNEVLVFQSVQERSERKACKDLSEQLAPLQACIPPLLPRPEDHCRASAEHTRLRPRGVCGWMGLGVGPTGGMGYPVTNILLLLTEVLLVLLAPQTA